MTFSATVVRVLVASPSDVPEARDAVESALNSWNLRYAAKRQIVVLPWRWESSSVPLLGKHPQALINEQGVDDADIIIAIFGSHLGSPTPDAVSGTVEEIERSLANGKPVHPYFSTASLPHDVDIEQLQGLRQFKEELQKKGLLGEFDDVRQLENQIWAAVEHDIEKLEISGQLTPNMQKGIRFKVDSKQERIQKSVDAKGRIKHDVKHWIEVTNVGDEAAESVTFEGRAEEGLLRLITDETRPIRLDPGSTWMITFAIAMGTAGLTLKIRWSEDGEEQEKEFDFQ